MSSCTNPPNRSDSMLHPDSRCCMIECTVSANLARAAAVPDFPRASISAHPAAGSITESTRAADGSQRMRRPAHAHHRRLPQIRAVDRACRWRATAITEPHYGELSRPAPRILIRTRRHGTAPVHTRQHGLFQNSRAVLEHHRPTVWKIAAHSGTQRRPWQAFPLVTALIFCAPEGTRTPNLLIRSQMLYPLSYGRMLLSYRWSRRYTYPSAPATQTLACPRDGLS
jgi:hypothetical protein